MGKPSRSCHCPSIPSDVAVTQRVSSLILSGLLLFFFVFLLIRSAIRVKEWFDASDPMLAEIHNRLLQVDPIADQIQLFRGSKSYTLNKRKVYICLYDEKKKYYPMNMLMYVAIHELAHCRCSEIGHTPKFFEIFKDLLEKAEKMGVYDPDIPPIDNYCMTPDEEDDE